MRTKLFQVVSLFALPIVIGMFTSGSVTAAPESLCKTFRKLLQLPSGSGLSRYQLFGTYGEGVDRFAGLDIDGDAIDDLVEKGCPGSNVPSDPCMLSIKLSSSGETLNFEAWGFRLFRYRERLYIDASADETRKKRNIYKIDKSGYELICENL
jgi:hypothetical protein